MNTLLTTRDWMELSAYLDEQMAPAQRARLEKRFEAEPALRSELEEMRRVRMMLRSLKPRKVPHNFTLTRQMAVERKRSPLVPWMGWSSVLTSLLLIFSLFLRMNLFSGGAQAPMMVTKEMSVAQPASQDQVSAGQQMPMILNWSAPLGIGGGSGQPGNMGINAAQPMVGAEGKGGGPVISSTQPPFVGFPLPGTDVTPSDNTAPNNQLRVVEQPTAVATQMVEVMATTAPAVEAPLPTEGQPEPNVKAVESDQANILGLPPVEDQGTMRVLETTRDTNQVKASQPSAVLSAIREWWLSLLLLALAIGSGLTALLLRRKRS